MGSRAQPLAAKSVAELELLGQRQHVGIEAHAEHDVFLDVLRLAMRLGLVEQAVERAEHLDEDGDGGVVKGHVMLSEVDVFCR